MIRSVRSVLTVLGSSLLLACSSAKPAPTTPAAKPASEVRAEEPIDLSPVSAPADVIGVMRVNRPGELVDGLVSFAGLPIDWRNMIAEDVPGFQDFVALDAPVDGVLVLAPGSGIKRASVLGAVSIGLRSVDGIVAAARKNGTGVQQIGPGVYRVGESDDEVVCVIAASAGAAPARLVCGSGLDDLQVLLPYMTRGLPRETIGARDLHAELRLDPIRRRYGNELRQLKALGVPMLLELLKQDEPEFDRALADAGHGLADEMLALLEDTDAIELDLVREGPQMVELSFTWRVRGATSTTVQGYRDLAAQAGPPPAEFWRLPADANWAFYGRAGKPERYAGFRRTVGELITKFLSGERAPAALGKATAGALDALYPDSGDTWYAQGSAPQRPGGSTVYVDEQGRFAAQIGWYVFAYKKDPAVVKASVDGLMRAIQAKDVRKVIAERMKLTAAQLPTVTSRPIAVPGRKEKGTEYRLTLPRAFVEELEELKPAEAGEGEAKPKPKAKVDKFMVSLVLLPADGHVWLAVASDPKLAVAKLQQSLSGAPENTLQSRTGLEPLRTTTLMSGGYFSVRGIMEAVAQAEGKSTDLSTTRAGGETPILFQISGSPNGSVAAKYAIRVPSQAVQDLVSGLAGRLMRH